MHTKCRSRGRGIGVNRESFRPGKLLPKQLARGDLLKNRKICKKVRLSLWRPVVGAPPRPQTPNSNPSPLLLAVAEIQVGIAF